MQPHDLRSTVSVLAGSGQITGHHITKDRAYRIADRAFGFIASWVVGLAMGYVIWGWRP